MKRIAALCLAILLCACIQVLEVNSFHHQAVKDIAPGLRVVARKR